MYTNFLVFLVSKWATICFCFFQFAFNLHLQHTGFGMLTLGCHKLILCISLKLLYTKNILLITIKGTHSQF